MRIQPAKSLITTFADGKLLQKAGLQNPNLLLRVLQRRLTELQKLRTAFVSSQRLFQRQLPRFHPSHDGFEFCKSGLEASRYGLCRRTVRGSGFTRLLGHGIQNKFNDNEWNGKAMQARMGTKSASVEQKALKIAQ
jgi:hypothetical protein